MKPTIKNRWFTRVSFKWQHLYAMIRRNSGRPMVTITLKMIESMGGKLTPLVVKNTVLIWRTLNRLARMQGPIGLVKYLKVCSVLTQQACSHYHLSDTGLLGHRIGLKNRVPKIIPANHRLAVRQGNPFLVRFYLTIFAAYRAINIPWKINLTTITAPSTATDEVFTDLFTYVGRFVKLIVLPMSTQKVGIFGYKPDKKYKYAGMKPTKNGWTPYFEEVDNPVKSKFQLISPLEWLKGHFKPFPTTKAAPVGSGHPDGNSAGIDFSTHPIVLWRAVAALTNPNAAWNPLIMRSLLTIVEASGIPAAKRLMIWLRKIFFTTGHLFNELPSKKSMTIKSTRIQWNKDYFAEEVPVDVEIPLESSLDRNSNIGKLGFKPEAAGKMRVFAIVDPVTQWALKPLHKFLFRVLRSLPMDGTFNQHGPLHRIPWSRKNLKLFSYDLTAATDRLPIKLQHAIITSIFSKEFADAWANLLINRPYKCSFASAQSMIEFCASKGKSLFFNKKDDRKEIFYETGQPMGALSSWAMLAITHHFIVQVAAWKSGIALNRGIFRNYALLGDDIVIWSSPVAREYLKIMKALGVSINLSKSIISKDGRGLEFAKRTIINGTDCSPITFRSFSEALTSVQSLNEFAKTHHLSLPDMFKAAGFGFKCLAKCHSSIRRLPSSMRDIALYFYLQNLHIRNPFSDMSNVSQYSFKAFYESELKLLQSQIYSTLNTLEDLMENHHWLHALRKSRFYVPHLVELYVDMFHFVYFDYFERCKKDLIDLSRSIADNRPRKFPQHTLLADLFQRGAELSQWDVRTLRLRKRATALTAGLPKSNKLWYAYARTLRKQITKPNK